MSFTEPLLACEQAPGEDEKNAFGRQSERKSTKVKIALAGSLFAG